MTIPVLKGWWGQQLHMYSISVRIDCTIVSISLSFTSTLFPSICLIYLIGNQWYCLNNTTGLRTTRIGVQKRFSKRFFLQFVWVSGLVEIKPFIKYDLESRSRFRTIHRFSIHSIIDTWDSATTLYYIVYNTILPAGNGEDIIWSKHYRSKR